MRQSQSNVDAAPGDLRRALRDLVALSTMPAVWAGKAVREIGQGLAELLVKTLSVELVYVRLPASGSEGTTEAVATSYGSPAAIRVDAAGKLFEPWLEAGAGSHV